ncbi:OmpP1/FadL family transporter [Sansalvadorimonas verongulae]|uniref:OmpP1/FadL family transporter n=1 Tax=Sansalvadorimonas verongulae TaxID=2172824 RepID=UPI0012BCEE80|nr:outer membrane protein transport protein [Sansalvadorimonas verongulae]MTI14350.1 transporter [Sansalvadorimonas verongulae]
MTRNSAIKFFALTALCAATQANAGAFQVNEHSAAGLGRAFAGEAAIADDASVVARNPAGMTELQGPMFSAVGSYVQTDVEVDSRVSGHTTHNKDVAKSSFVPAMFYTTPIDDKLSVGFGVFSNYGFNTKYGKESTAAAGATHSDVKSVNFNTSLAYKLQDNLSVGFGVNAVYVQGELDSYLNNSAKNRALAALQSDLSAITELLNIDLATLKKSASKIDPAALGSGTIINVKGDDWGFGWNAGVLWEPLKGTRIGASYRSEVKTSLEGKAKSDVFNGQGIVPQFNSKGSVDFDMPAIAELSVYQDVTDQLAVHASYMRTYWSSFKEITVKLKSGVPVPSEQKDFRDSSRWAIGTTYKLDDQWTLRAGYAYDNSPVRNSKRDFRIPDVDRQWYTAGASYKIDNAQKVDFGYALLRSKEADVSHITPLATIEGKIKAAKVNIFSVQYNYVF